MKYPVVFAVADIETGGLSASKNPICEIAICPIDEELNNLEEYTSIIAPYDDKLEYTDGALKANGMSMEMIKGGKDSKEVVRELCQYLTSLKRGRALPILCGHNISKFDIPFLEAFFTFHGKDLWKFVEKSYHIDTMWWARTKWTESTNYKLTTCCDNVGIELVDAHRAVNDTRSNKQLVIDFIKSLRGNGDGSVEVNRYRKTFEF